MTVVLLLELLGGFPEGLFAFFEETGFRLTAQCKVGPVSFKIKYLILLRKLVAGVGFEPTTFRL
jgi:hypothetical protein